MHNQVIGYDSNGLPNATKNSVKFRTNPNPKQAYKVKVTMHDTPGKWEYIKFYTLYQAQNCRYTTNRFAGATSSPEYYLEIENKGFHNNQMEGIFYLDAMLDEDYYGQGVCRWKLTSITAHFRASNDPNDTLFVFSEFYNTLKQNNNSLTSYYFKKDYPKTYLDGKLFGEYTEFGEKKEYFNLTDDHKQDLFSITMSIQEVKS